MRKTILTALMALMTATSMRGETQDTCRTNILEKAVNLAETILDAMTIEKEGWSLAVYPAASYSGRQGLAVGIMPMLQLRSESLPRPTTITPSALISTKKMWEIQCDADIYLHHDQTIVTKAEFYYLPDTYYGYANKNADNVEMAEFKFKQYLLTADYLKGLGRGWQAGMTFDLSKHIFSEIEVDTTINYDIASELREAEGWANGIGVTISYDTRDNVLNARSGWYAKAKATLYRKGIGSEENFNTTTVDIRHYWPLGQESVVAAQMYVATASTDAPFHKMATMGGTRLGRAIPHNLKYVDRFAYLLQGEVRFPLWWRIGATCWSGIGNVGHEANLDMLKDVHGMIGGGLRFKVFPEHGLNLRLDGGISTQGDRAIYFNIREAF